MSEQAATIIADDEAATDDPNAALDAMRKLMGGFSAPKKAERKTREKKVRGITDGRSLRAKGRTMQFNAMIKPEIKQAILDRAKEEGISMADFLERALLKELGMWGN